MIPGKILFAENDGTYLIKLAGEVRLNLCSSLEAFLEKMFDEPDFKSVIIDLSETDTIDSTSLGLLAKLSIKARKKLGLVPIIISTREDITRILESMSLDSVFRIVSNLAGMNKINLNFMNVGCEGVVEQSVQARRVLDAHKVLMSLNEENKQAFRDLVKQLEKLQSKDSEDD